MKKEIKNYMPYNITNVNGQYADIAFESKGIMTVPKNSASTLIELLNDAFNNGVKMSIIESNKVEAKLEIKAKPMQQEEPHPINSYLKKNK